MVKNSKEPKKRGLGRGLEALFDETPQVQETEEITEISLDDFTDAFQSLVIQDAMAGFDDLGLSETDLAQIIGGAK